MIAYLSQSEQISSQQKFLLKKAVFADEKDLIEPCTIIINEGQPI